MLPVSIWVFCLLWGILSCECPVIPVFSIRKNIPIESVIIKIVEIAMYKYSFLESTKLWIEAKNSTEMTYPIGIIRTLLSGESGKCCNPPVTAPIPTASIAPASIVFHVFVASSSIMVHMIKQRIPKAPVRSERVPEKTQCDIAPVMKLIPIYLIRVEK